MSNATGTMHGPLMENGGYFSGQSELVAAEREIREDQTRKIVEAVRGFHVAVTGCDADLPGLFAELIEGWAAQES